MEFRNTALLGWIRMTWYVVEESVPIWPLTERILMESLLHPVTEPERHALAGGSRIYLGGDCSYLAGLEGE